MHVATIRTHQSSMTRLLALGVALLVAVLVLSWKLDKDEEVTQALVLGRDLELKEHMATVILDTRQVGLADVGHVAEHGLVMVSP